MIEGHTNYLHSQQVIAGGDTLGDGERHLSLVGDEPVDTPGTCRRVVSVFPDLEPLQACYRRLSRRADLGTGRGSRIGR